MADPCLLATSLSAYLSFPRLPFQDPVSSVDLKPLPIVAAQQLTLSLHPRRFGLEDRPSWVSSSAGPARSGRARKALASVAVSGEPSWRATTRKCFLPQSNSGQFRADNRFHHSNLATYATLFGLPWLEPVIWIWQRWLYSKYVQSSFRLV